MANLVMATFEKESLQVLQKAKTIPYSFFTIYSFDTDAVMSNDNE